MEILQTRLELQGMVQQWINATMQQYNISPSMMDDALSKALLSVKEQVIQEFLIAAQTASSIQEKNVEEDSDDGDPDYEN